jgi:undecaprenyl-diphosphatase
MLKNPRLKVSSIGLAPLIAGAILLVVSAVLATASIPSSVERAVFDFFFDLPDGGQRLFQIVGAVGMLGLLAFAILSAWFNRDPLRIGLLVIALVGAFAANYVTKQWIITRARPGELFGITPRGIADPTPMGFPSGHMAIVAVLTIIVVHLVPSRIRPWLWLVALIVGAGRIYTGEHMPLDVVGGLGIGLIAGSLAEMTTRLRANTKT